MELPPSSVVRAVVQRYARLQIQLKEELGDRPLVLPDGEFFPDTFRPDHRSVKKLVLRMRRHAGMADIPVNPRLVDPERPPEPGGCGCSAADQACNSTPAKAGGGDSCTCAADSAGEFCRLVDEGDAWRLQIPEPEMLNPTVLTARVARDLGQVFLLETREEGQAVDQPLAVTAELTAVALGFGVLLLQGSYIYSNSCGGPRVGRVTTLGAGELAIATALFVHLGRHSPRRARDKLDTTQRALFSEATTWAKSNQSLLTRLQQAPEQLANGKFEITEAKPWLARLWGSRSAQKRERSAAEDLDLLADGADLAELESALESMPARKAPAKKKPDPKHDELRALVEESLDQARE
jgi:hypothetical protein